MSLEDCIGGNSEQQNIIPNNVYDCIGGGSSANWTYEEYRDCIGNVAEEPIEPPIQSIPVEINDSWVIIYPEGAENGEQEAIADLHQYFWDVAEIRLQVYSDEEYVYEPGDKIISVGHTNLVDFDYTQYNLDKDDSVTIIEEDRIFFLGIDKKNKQDGYFSIFGDSQGSAYAVYQFIEDILGVIWLGPGQDYFETLPKVITEEGITVNKPQIKTRQLKVQNHTPEHQDWIRRMRITTERLTNANHQFAPTLNYAYYVKDVGGIPTGFLAGIDGSWEEHDLYVAANGGKNAYYEGLPSTSSFETAAGYHLEQVKIEFYAKHAGNTFNPKLSNDYHMGPSGVVITDGPNAKGIYGVPFSGHVPSGMKTSNLKFQMTDPEFIAFFAKAAVKKYINSVENGSENTTISLTPSDAGGFQSNPPFYPRPAWTNDKTGAAYDYTSVVLQFFVDVTNYINANLGNFYTSGFLYSRYGFPDRNMGITVPSNFIPSLTPADVYYNSYDKLHRLTMSAYYDEWQAQLPEHRFTYYGYFGQFWGSDKFLTSQTEDGTKLAGAIGGILPLGAELLGYIYNNMAKIKLEAVRNERERAPVNQGTNWLNAKMMNNPGQDITALKEKFLRASYGHAIYTDINDYDNLLETIIKDLVSRGYWLKTYSPEVFRAIEPYIDSLSDSLKKASDNMHLLEEEQKKRLQALLDSYRIFLFRLINGTGVVPVNTEFVISTYELEEILNRYIVFERETEDKYDLYPEHLKPPFPHIIPNFMTRFTYNILGNIEVKPGAYDNTLQVGTKADKDFRQEDFLFIANKDNVDLFIEEFGNTEYGFTFAWVEVTRYVILPGEISRLVNRKIVHKNDKVRLIQDAQEGDLFIVHLVFYNDTEVKFTFEDTELVDGEYTTSGGTKVNPPIGDPSFIAWRRYIEEPFLEIKQTGNNLEVSKDKETFNITGSLTVNKPVISDEFGNEILITEPSADKIYVRVRGRQSAGNKNRADQAYRIIDNYGNIRWLPNSGAEPPFALFEYDKNKLGETISYHVQGAYTLEMFDGEEAFYQGINTIILE